MRDTPADEIDAITDDVVERRARVRAVLDGHPVAAAPTPPPPQPPTTTTTMPSQPTPPQLELLR